MEIEKCNCNDSLRYRKALETILALFVERASFLKIKISFMTLCNLTR